MNGNDYKIMRENEILEKEIEKEKLKINNKNFRNYLISKERDKEETINKKKKKNINKKFVGKKRKDTK